MSKLNTRSLSPIYARLTYEQKRGLVQEVAHYMVRNGQSSLPIEDAERCLAEALGRFNTGEQIVARDVREILVERSGVLREPQPDRLDFVHNTLKEYLAGDRFAHQRDVGLLAEHALDAAWQPSILFAAAASKSPDFTDQLIDRLLALAGDPVARIRRWWSGADAARAIKLFAVQCGGAALNLSQRNRERLNEILTTTQRPLNLSEAESFAALGDFVVQYLNYDQKLSARTLVACARTLRLIDTDAARECLKGYGDEERPTVVAELRQILDPLQLRVVQQKLLPIVECDPGAKERLQDAPQEKVFEVLSGLHELNLRGIPPADPAPLAELAALQRISVSGTAPQNIARLAHWASIERLRGRIRCINSVGIALAPIPAGEFRMGCPRSEEGHDDERPQHHVHITRPFLMAMYPVTQHEYREVTGQNPSRFTGEERGPVESVTWSDAVRFCNRLSGTKTRSIRRCATNGFL